MNLKPLRPFIPIFSLALATPLSGCVVFEESDGTSNKLGEGVQNNGTAGVGPSGDKEKNGKKKSSKKDGLPGAGHPGDNPGLPNPGGSTGGQGTGTDTANGSGTDSTGTDTQPSPECNEADAVTLFLSPDDSNSLSSPSQLKQRLELFDTSSALYGLPIRGWEFFNYYNFPYDQPQGTLGANLQLRPASETPGHYRLQIGVRSKNWTYETRPAMNLTFVLDTSGSMQGPAMNMLKASVRAIAGGLRQGDKVSMVTWSSSQQVLLDSHTVSAATDPAVLRIAESLVPGGGTDLHGGLSKGYQLAQKNYINNAINRIILVSDGGANLGVTSHQLIGQHAKDSGRDGIYLAGVGVGTATSYHDKLMDAVTDAGKGASVFIPSDAEAKRIFGDQFLSTFGIAAKNVQVQLDLPPGFEILEFSGEEVNTDPTKVEPQHLAPNDSMVFYQEIKTCAPEKFDPNAKVKVTVRYEDALTHEPGQVIAESTFAQLLQAPALALGKGTALTLFLDALKAMQTAKPDTTTTLMEAKQELNKQIALSPNDPELKEMLAQLNKFAGP